MEEKARAKAGGWSMPCGLVLVVGGAHQGKRKVCLQLSGLKENEYQENLADGRYDLPGAAFEKPFLASFHQFLRQVLQEGGDPGAYTKNVLAAGPRIISMDEVGCGVIPLEREDREYREAVGRCGQMLAAGAEAVYRVTCGIAFQIK